MIIHTSYFKNIFYAFIFAIIYCLSYVFFLNNYFDYEGFTLTNLAERYPLVMASVIVAVIPICFYSGFKALSSFFSVFIYLILYMPIVLTFTLGTNYSILDTILIELTFLFSMCLLFLADRIVINNRLNLRVSFSIFPVIFYLTILSTIYMLYKYKGSLQLVSFGKDVYSQRSANADLGADVLTRYLSSWLSGFMIPICLSYGLIYKKRIYFIVGTVACFIIYMASAAKAIVLYPFVYLCFFFLFKNNKVNNAFPILALSLIISFSVLLLTADLESITFLIGAMLIYRTIGNGGLLAMEYNNFFLDHPHTYYTHINFVNLLTKQYPYGKNELGFVVGEHFGGIGLNANASFWVTDGIAAMGLPGVVFISFIIFVFFCLINSLTRGFEKLFVILTFLPFLVFLLNASLLTSLWTGGAIFLMIFFLLNKKEGIKHDQKA